MQLSTERGDLTLRVAQADEWQAYRRLRLMALQQHPSFFGSDYAQNAAEPDRYWQERMANLDPSKQQILVAVAESQFVAMVMIRRYTDPKSSHQADLGGVYTDPTWRGYGLIRQLLGMAEAWAWQQSVQIIRLAVNVANTSAIQLYTRCGYRVYGVEPMAIYYEGVYHDELLMAKQNVEHRA